jgi:hypothetical protein
MNDKHTFRQFLPHIRFWSRGLIAASARYRIDDLIRLALTKDAQAMIDEWIA